VLVLVRESWVELIDVYALSLGVKVEEDRLIIHVREQHLMQLLSGSHLRSCSTHVNTLGHSILHVFVVHVRGKWKFLGAALLKEAESSLAESGPGWIILDVRGLKLKYLASVLLLLIKIEEEGVALPFRICHHH
jgi:hypothetical protein